MRRRDEREGTVVLRGREHLHARHVVAPLESELLQVHQRDAQRDGRLEPPRRAALRRGGERRVRGRRLRDRARVRRDPDDRRPLDRGELARSAAARRAARHRRPDARARQAQGAPRRRRPVLHQRRRRARRAREGVEAGRRDRAAVGVRRAGARARRRARRGVAARRCRARDRAAPAAAHDRRARLSLHARRRDVRPRRAQRDDHRARTARAAARRRRRDRRGGRRVVAARARARARRRDPDAAHERARARACCCCAPKATRTRCSPSTARCSRCASTGSCARRSACCGARSRGSTSLAQPVRDRRAGLVLRGNAAGARARRGPHVHARARGRRRARAGDRAGRDELRRVPDGERPHAARDALRRRRRRVRTPARRARPALSRRGRARRGPRHRRARRARLGRRDPARARRARVAVARRADRDGSEPALPRRGDARRRRSSAASRRGRTGCSTAPTPPARPVRSNSSAAAPNRASTRNGSDSHGDRLRGTHPQQRRALVEPHAAARARALAAGVPVVVERDGADRFQRGRRLLAHGDLRRREGLGELRLRAHAGVPLGHLPRGAGDGPPRRLRRRLRQTGVAASPRRVPQHAAPADRHARRHRARVGGAAAAARPHRAVAVRPAQSLPSQRRGRPPPLGDGVPAARVLRARRPRGSRRAARAPLRRRRQPAHPADVQRADLRLAVVLHVHVLHRPRREVPAQVVRGVELRPARAHVPLHAHRRSAPHVRRRHRHLARRQAHARGDRGDSAPTSPARSAARARSTCPPSSAT